MQTFFWICVLPWNSARFVVLLANFISRTFDRGTRSSQRLSLAQGLHLSIFTSLILISEFCRLVRREKIANRSIQYPKLQFKYPEAAACVTKCIAYVYAQCNRTSSSKHALLTSLSTTHAYLDIFPTTSGVSKRVDRVNSQF